MLAIVKAAAWAILGGLIITYLFFVAIGTVDLATAGTASLIVLGAALVWAWHARTTLLRGGASSRSDRERRGF